MYSSVFAKSLHNAYSYSGGWEILGEREILMQFYSGGWEILGEREILMQFFFKWKVDFQLFLFKGGKYPFDDEAKPFFYPEHLISTFAQRGGAKGLLCA